MVQKMGWIVLSIVLLNVFDLVFTYWGVQIGLLVEKNPLLCETVGDFYLFAVTKMGLIGLGLYAIVLHKMIKVLWSVLVIYSILVVYELSMLYEVYCMCDKNLNYFMTLIEIS